MAEFHCAEMSYQEYAYLMWAGQFVLYVLLFARCWFGGARRLLPVFTLFIGWEIVAGLAAFSIIYTFGFSSGIYLRFYNVTSVLRCVIELVVVYEILRLIAVRRFVWWVSGAAVLTAAFLAISLNSAPGRFEGYSLVQASLLHLIIYLSLGLLIGALLQARVRVGTNIAGALLLIFLDSASLYMLFSAQVFAGVDYTWIRWFIQPTLLCGTLIALNFMKRLDWPVALRPQPAAGGQAT